MRVNLLSGVIAAVFLVGMPTAMAQSNSDGDNGADTTCSDFMAMETADQTALIEQLQSATPDLKTNGAEGSNASANASGGMSAEGKTPSDDANGSSAGDVKSDDSASADTKAGATPDSNVAEVLAACESDSNMSVGDALTR